MAKDYGDASIKTLDPVTHIRTRPGMYVGEPGTGAMYHDCIYILMKEVIDNSIDGFVARLGNMDRVTATKPPQAPGIAYDGLSNPWPTYGNEGNPSTRWCGRLGLKGENVLAAGRCIGAPDTIDTFRLICPCFVSGQAAGTAAALAAQKGVSPRALPYEDLRAALLKASCHLG